MTRANVLAVALLAAMASPAFGAQGTPGSAQGTPGSIDLSKALIIGPASPSVQEQTALRVLVEEVERRTIIRLPIRGASDSTNASGSTKDRPLIVVGTAANLRDRVADVPGGLPSTQPPGPEGFVIRVDATRALQPVVSIVGADARGMLFGVGRLLREMTLTRGRIAIASNLQIATAPKIALRGHQIGYRPKTNSYDGWDVPMWEQYIRDLAVFGTNAFELIPPVSDDDEDSPHFPRPQIDMMIEVSRILDRYGLDVWVWYPALEKDYVTPANVDKAVSEWADVLKRLPRVDAVFVPGGDPGHTKPDVLFALLEKQTASLKKYHPKATMWVSPQGFTKEWMDEFYALLRKEPQWLTGVVFAPQNRDSFALFRKNVPARYRIRHYPDITHSLRAQYPVNDWDVAHALTSSREPINPRPVDQAVIFRHLMTYGPDFITYSEGCNDDVNKVVWSGLGWDPKTDVVEILRQFSRYFIGARYTDSFAEGLLALERNWRGPLATNTGVYATLQQFQAMERGASPSDLLNWRFQQALYRAYYDAYERARLIAETAQESEAIERLRAARVIGSISTMEDAEHILRRGDQMKPAADWRQRIYSLAEALYQSVRMQLDVEHYRAIGVDRGATLASAETPLNDRRWLRAQFERIRGLSDEAARVKELDRIAAWTDPGPGGYYDDLGDPSNQPHLVRGVPFEQDPGPYRSGATGFGNRPEWRLSWVTHAESFYDDPLTLRYAGLDPTARYRLRIVYAGDIYSPAKIKIVANGTVEIAPPTPKPNPVQPLEFDIPAAATARGTLTLDFTQEPGRGGAGRGCQLAEAWLIRQESVQ
jgi:hypothetical protein